MTIRIHVCIVPSNFRSRAARQTELRGGHTMAMAKKKTAAKKAGGRKTAAKKTAKKTTTKKRGKK